VADAERFEERFGLRYDEPQIRFRVLDPVLRSELHLIAMDMALPLSQFRDLEWPAMNVVVVENKMTFLTLPVLPRALGVWGGGGAAELLTSVRWLARCQLFYWGDLDVHGFHILSRLRRAFPSLASVMMDEATLTQFRGFAVSAKESGYESVAGLTSDEQLVYEHIQLNRLLLEQEKVPHSHAVAQLEVAVGARDR
jgi:hypothetical protein